MITFIFDSFKEVKFPPGRVVMTSTVADKFKNQHDKLTQCLQRHLSGDWGESSDPEFNDEALDPNNPDTIFSVYTIDETVIWIITEWDRSVTTILFSDDY